MEIIDKSDRNIQLKESFDTIRAYHNGKEVGFIQFLTVDCGNFNTLAYPEQMNIVESYQRNGIATQIIKYAQTIYDIVKFAEDNGCGGNTNKIHYSDEGLQFKNYCELKGITQTTSYYVEEEELL